MKKLIPILAILILPLSAQALTVSSNGGADVSVGSTKASVDARSETTGTQEANKDSESDSDNGVDVSAEVLAATSGHASTTGIANALTVESDTDLTSFTDTIRASNKNVDSVDTKSDDNVAVEYAHEAKLFGFIPVHITSRTTVRANADGGVAAETSFPWWKIFVTGVADTTDTVDSAIEASASAKAYVAAKTSAHAKAVLAETVVATLNAEAGVSLLGQ